MARPDETEADIVARGRRRVLELCLDALEAAEDVMLGNGPPTGNAARVAACRFILDMAQKGPFELQAPQDDLDGQRLENRAREAIAEVLQITALYESAQPPSDEEGGDNGSD